MDDITQCPMCLSTLKDPKTLPCLHSCCKECLEGFAVKAAEGPLSCPKCGNGFAVPGNGIGTMATNYFTRSLVGIDYDSTQDPSSLICAICDESGGSTFCLQCAQFFCEGCQRAHKRARGTAKHEFISSEVALTDQGSIRVPTCPTHANQEITAFCLTCKEPICPECGIRSHSTHAFSELKDATLKFHQELKKMLETVRKREAALKEAVETLAEALEELSAHSKTADDSIRNCFADLRLDVDRREREVLEELRKTKEKKEEELRQHKEDLEALLVGIQVSTGFTEKLLAEGTEVEVAMSKAQVLGRLEYLAKASCSTDMVYDALVTFGEDNREKIVDSIKSFGNIVLKPLTAEMPLIDRGNTQSSLYVGDMISFSIVNPNKDRKKKNTQYLVEIQGEYGVQVKVSEKADGSHLVYFTASFPGIYNAAVKLKGRNIKGSPFEIVVMNRLRYKSMTQPVLVFGTEGDNDGQLAAPFAVCTNDAGDILVADSRNHRIQAFDSKGRFLFNFGSKGSGPGQLNTPCGLALDPARQRILVADAGNYRVQIFDQRGKHLKTIGSKGVGDGQFDRPWSVAIDDEGQIIVADFGNHRIQVFSGDGKFIRKFGGQDQGGEGKLKRPIGIGVLSSGHFVIAENGNSRIQIVDPQGNIVRLIGMGQLKKPWHLCVDDDDRILVCDYSNNRIQVFDQNGANLCQLGAGVLTHPTGVCLDKDGRVVVTVFGNHRVEVFDRR